MRDGDDERLFGAIEELVAEEHRLLDRGERDGGLDDAGHARLRAVQVQLDRLWDLMRQRRAREEAGLDPGEASPRDADTVEGYEQ